MRRGRRLAAAAAGTVAVGVAVFVADRLFPPELDRYRARSAAVLAADGRMLRAFPAPGGYWRLRTAPDQVDPLYRRMLIAYEDKRFATHAGVDPVAVARAAWQAATAGRIVSGASTLTMQAASLLEPRSRSIAGKIGEMLRALQIERRLGKDDVLSLYLTLAPFGGNVEGVRAAALAYFGKEPARLTPGQAALLVAIPKSPERLRPDRHPGRARAQRDAVLDRMAEAGVLTAREAAEAKQEPVPTARRTMPFHAPLLARRVRPDGNGRVRTTIDYELQGRLETLARHWRHRIAADASLAILVRRNGTGEAAAYVGSADFFADRRAGQVDMVTAVRSPGSTLKPFIYALAFDDGVAHPDTLVNDAPSVFGDYEPENFSREFNGEVTVREALQRSLNVPAVVVLDRIGPARFAARLRKAGVDLRLPSLAAASGLPVALGGVGLALEDLVSLYGALADGGAFRPLRLLRDGTPAASVPLYRRAAAWQVARILEGVPRPGAEGATLAGRRAIAWKTGTSYGYRDAWAIGFDRDHTVGVWVGRADGTPSPGSLGRTAAGPLLFAAFGALPAPRTAIAEAPPPDTQLYAGGALPPYLRRLGPPPAPDTARTGPPPRIVFPPDGATIAREDGDGRMILEADGGAMPLRWLADGDPIGASRRHRRVPWTPQGQGFSRITVIDANGRAASADVRIR